MKKNIYIFFFIFVVIVLVVEIYVEKWILPLKCKDFLFTGVVDKFRQFPQRGKIKFFQNSFHSFFIPIPQGLWKKLQTGIDVGSNITNVVLQGGITTE